MYVSEWELCVLSSLHIVGANRDIGYFMIFSYDLHRLCTCT